jgi:alkylhydroperoxidase family enzyme
MDTFLPPVEQPKSPAMRLAYVMTRRRFGKVLTPLKVFCARLPVAFGLFYSKISDLDKKLELSQEMQLLIREQVARINVCAFCVDIGRSIAIRAALSEAKFDALHEYAASPLFSEPERAVLRYVEELARTRNVVPETFAQMAKHYSERAICEIVWLVASEHFYNITNIGLNIHSDMLCEIKKKRK